ALFTFSHLIFTINSGQNKIFYFAGYFWHITDIHYDPKYAVQGNTPNTKCWNMRNIVDGGRMRLDRKLAGKFGDYSCDSPWALIESAARAMRSKHGDIEFVLWTGDALTRNAGMNAELRLQCLRNLTELLHRTFKGQFVFPALGHEDIGLNYTQLASVWQNWLPPEAVDTFVKAGYYTIEQRSKKYRIVFLNTNLWLNPVDSRMLHRSGSSTVDNTQDPFGQWSWFQSVLENARKKKETRARWREGFKVEDASENRGYGTNSTRIDSYLDSLSG
ncbi:ASM3B phosphodiesterase, partial [Pseudoatta argentina]